MALWSPARKCSGRLFFVFFFLGTHSEEQKLFTVEVSFRTFNHHIFSSEITKYSTFSPFRVELRCVADLELF